MKQILNQSTEISDPLITSLAYGPRNQVTCYSEYMVNGFRFHTFEHAQDKATMNCGVCVRSSCYNDTEYDFFGVLEEILEFQYCNLPNMYVTLFKCRWVDPMTGQQTHPKYGIIDVNLSRIYKTDEPFVLAQQAIQVYYVGYPGSKRNRVNWMAAFKTKARSTVEVKWSDIPFQPSNEFMYGACSTQLDVPLLHDPSDIGEHVDSDEDVEDDMYCNKSTDSFRDTSTSTSPSDSEFSDSIEGGNV